MQRCTSSLLLLCFAASGAAAGTVTVSYVNAPGFADAGPTAWEREATLKALSAHLQALGQRHLPAEQTLQVDVLDLDLAGALKPSRRAGQDLRVVKGAADWPRINLRYTLVADGKPVLSGEERVADMNYAAGIASQRNSDPLHYEKRMLDTWFKARIVERRAAGD